MVIDMNETKLTTIGQIREFLAGTADIYWTPEEDDQARYAFIRNVLSRFDYRQLVRPDKGLIRVYLGRTSGYSRAQLARLIRQYLDCGRVVQRYAAPQAGFARTYTDADVRLLSETDALHCTLSGLATKKLMERAYGVFGETRYERLATISVAHLYNLRKRNGYRRHRQVWTKTRPVTIAIGERRAPAPNNRPGYLRVDSVHQGDQDGVKGLYHINAVDCVTQYEAVATCERISEAFLIPVLAELLASFPFVILGFHVDNGSEYINRHVAELLNKLLIEEFTKSRSRHSNDNAQAESKNGAIVRKHLGYSHIPQRFAALVNAFDSEYLNPYVNFHRPCLFAETITDAKGRQRKRYPYKLMMTPYEKFKSLPLAEQFLKPGITFLQLDALATAMSDNEAARLLNQARATLFKTISNRSKTAA
jgi:transposase InsO family protein